MSTFRVVLDIAAVNEAAAIAKVQQQLDGEVSNLKAEPHSLDAPEGLVAQHLSDRSIDESDYLVWERWVAVPDNGLDPARYSPRRNLCGGFSRWELKFLPACSMIWDDGAWRPICPKDWEEEDN